MDPDDKEGDEVKSAQVSVSMIVRPLTSNWRLVKTISAEERNSGKSASQGNLDGNVWKSSNRRTVYFFDKNGKENEGKTACQQTCPNEAEKSVGCFAPCECCCVERSTACEDNRSMITKTFYETEQLPRPEFPTKKRCQEKSVRKEKRRPKKEPLPPPPQPPPPVIDNPKNTLPAAALSPIKPVPLPTKIVPETAPIVPRPAAPVPSAPKIAEFDPKKKLNPELVPQQRSPNPCSQPPRSPRSLSEFTNGRSFASLLAQPEVYSHHEWFYSSEGRAWLALFAFVVVLFCYRSSLPDHMCHYS
ncbi:unnamed protein product [Caenorhabditis auriculariae]|uniref:Uncharacterized protein n=1 Tax=Caenorhabditis auriculariae TaxID=2777116 RepID=A0A8S1GZN4_9PELO|nr:unnamed protein product [Caenorhabditis auriculariae]